jgi:hypothetical protein
MDRDTWKITFTQELIELVGSSDRFNEDYNLGEVSKAYKNSALSGTWLNSKLSRSSFNFLFLADSSSLT